ncbi:uncharacterized protein LOC141665084 [Apium graveolens]|uniref:uncharacterized protein LOC141665084 n=1 Tax=Apium graveolens TaxID=4045 RepID=UPI003D7AA21F
MDKSWMRADRDSLEGHLYEKGFSLGYVTWIWHGASANPRSSAASTILTPSSVNIEENIKENIGALEVGDICKAAYNQGNLGDDCDKDSDEFKRFLSDAEQPLFEGSDSSKLESMLKLHNWKARFRISDSAFTDLLSSVGSLLLKDHVLPINAGVNSDIVECPKCRKSRWKLGKDGKERVNVPAKVMWYFPIISRFKRMFKSESTAKLMTWHVKQRSQDGHMRHPADSPSWRNVDYRWPTFDNEPRNIRLALAANGINPHNKGLKNRYSCWPVVLATYNLPPWFCMKRKYMMLTVLVSGPQEPSNNIDVFLQPLIDDLKKLWEEGEPNVFDAHTKFFFTLKAILMWTINDFPAYGNLSGCVNKGYISCHVCGDDTVAKYLPHSKKISSKEVKEGGLSMEKKSIFFDLEYWKFHHVRHCLDVMHVEKNVCDNLIGTLLNIRYKTKDSEGSRLDMIQMGVRKDLAPQKIGEKRTYLPPSAFTLSKTEKKKLLKSLASMKLPYGHSSNIKNCVLILDLKLYRLKFHDCHKNKNEAVKSRKPAKNENVYLQTKVRKRKHSDMFAFIDPSATFKLNDDFQNYIIARMRSGPSRIFLLPHNESYHWILIMIWESEIFILNPLPHQKRFTALEEALVGTIRSDNAQIGCVNKNPTIKNLIGSPKQPGGSECGYVVMRYMKDIYEDKEMKFLSKWGVKCRKSYTKEQLDEVWFETLQYIQEFV